MGHTAKDLHPIFIFLILTTKKVDFTAILLGSMIFFMINMDKNQQKHIIILLQLS